MDAKTAIRMIESGKAQCLYTTVLIVRIEDVVYISFDGKVWEKSDNAEVKKQL